VLELSEVSRIIEEGPKTFEKPKKALIQLRDLMTVTDECLMTIIEQNNEIIKLLWTLVTGRTAPARPAEVRRELTLREVVTVQGMPVVRFPEISAIPTISMPVRVLTINKYIVKTTEDTVHTVGSEAFMVVFTSPNTDVYFNTKPIASAGASFPVYSSTYMNLVVSRGTTIYFRAINNEGDLYVMELAPGSL